ncbi:hypothetical protein [Phenylobacterium sp.]|jgi:hypothetical protein|uniref:hypothetical protein n=1 Tax=Phenylobacterium sp. TaxID=1871053 RepID=UPI002E317FE6|nr:hypothetical protein [Phenylobacterium sp.]HEX2559621.1 hypothetical protein [Phenylobacterium sp.]
MDHARIAQARRLRPYFELQLRFAQALAGRTGEPLDRLALTMTNLHRRFGLGDPDERPERPEWAAYAAGLRTAAALEAKLDWTEAVFVRSPEEVSGRPRFGCFSYDPPNADGEVRIHFTNRDDDDVSPLTAEKVPRRLADLRALFAYVRERHPEAAFVRGGSWLYNTEAYRRLFPPAYGASRRAPERVRLNGTSSWGQFLDHREATKPAARDAFLENLAGLDPAAPWTAFPLRALHVRAPIDLFYAFYGLAPAPA